MEFVFLLVYLSMKLADNYQTIEEVQEALRKSGLESSSLIIGIGKRTFLIVYGEAEIVLMM